MTSTQPSRAVTARDVVAELHAERRRIAMAFRAAGATSAAQAQPLERLGLAYDMQVDYLVRLGAIHDVEHGYWLDEGRFERTVEHPRFRRIGVVLVGAIFLLTLLTLIGVLRAG